MDLIVSFDTSNYTTSVAVASLDGEIKVNKKLLLPVKSGERGLRQSDALFHHISRLPSILDGIDISGNICAVGYSNRPRNVEGSYMPCFLAGELAAVSMAKALNCPIYSFSHQDGHIMAALYSANKLELIGKEFYAFHISGGTTEILSVKPSSDYTFEVEQIGGTLDLNCGQVIDRVGVLMGCSFPAGKELEELAKSYRGKLDRYKICVKGTECNLSGLENKASELYQSTGDRERVAAFTLNAITKTLMEMTENVFELYGEKPVIYAGGVMSCSLIKKFLSAYGDFALPEYSSDNAAGNALLVRNAFLSDKAKER